MAPVEAIKRVLKKTGLTIGDIDLFEITEAFSAVSLAINRELGLDSRESTSTVGRSRWAIRLVPPVRGFSRRCSMRWKPGVPVEVSPASVSGEEKRWQ
jgi:acetyl-CoA acetyltransferase